MPDESNSVDFLAETENFEIYSTDDPEDDRMYHIDLGRLTLHLYTDEWEELVALIKKAASKRG
jgi:hypothetical protein